MAKIKSPNEDQLNKMIFCAKCLIHSQIPTAILSGCKVLQYLTDQSNDLVLDKVASGNTIPKLMQHLSTYCDNLELLKSCIRIVTNMTTSNKPELTLKVVTNGILDRQVQILQTQLGSDMFIEIFWCLGNIAADSEECIEHVITHPVL